MSNALCNKSLQQISAQTRVTRSVRPARVPVVCRAQHAEVDRRAVLGLIAGTASLLSSVAPSSADFGDSANVFGKVTNKTGFVPYQGENFAVLLPSRWNPSKEREFPGIVLRYEDNGDAVNHMLVLTEPTDKDSIEAYGSPEKFLESVSYLLGKQSFSGETESEGGFAPGRVSAASLLGVTSEKDKKGRTYYKYEILTRTGDGNEGGRHQLIKATVSNGNLYVLKVQAGDKRWFKGANKDCLGTLNSFTVA
ncbi:oxygen-evolving enhancer protein 2, chloroplastic [Haematococcus lacustris]